MFDNFLIFFQFFLIFLLLYFCLFTFRLSLKMLQKITPIPIYFLRIISKNHKFTVQRIRKNDKRLNFGYNFLKNFSKFINEKWQILKYPRKNCLKENNSFCFDQGSASCLKFSKFSFKIQLFRFWEKELKKSLKLWSWKFVKRNGLNSNWKKEQLLKSRL